MDCVTLVNAISFQLLFVPTYLQIGFFPNTDTMRSLVRIYVPDRRITIMEAVIWSLEFLDGILAKFHKGLVCKDGGGFNYYHLLLCLSNTQEVFSIINEWKALCGELQHRPSILSSVIIFIYDKCPCMFLKMHTLCIHGCRCPTTQWVGYL